MKFKKDKDQEIEVLENNTTEEEVESATEETEEKKKFFDRIPKGVKIGAAVAAGIIGAIGIGKLFGHPGDVENFDDFEDSMDADYTPLNDDVPTEDSGSKSETSDKETK